jgi:hypothetical protein
MGLFKSVSDKLREMKQRAKNKKQFISNVMQSVQDGELTDVEMDELTGQYKEFGITESELKKIRLTAYIAASKVVRQDGIVTNEEYEKLKKIQQFLKIPDEDIRGTKQELTRLCLINEIQQGNLPAITTSPVILQKSEKAHWVEPGALLEERVISRRYEGGSHGVSIRIMRGVSYRVGAHRGHIVSETGIVPVSSGDFVITNKRAIFSGDKKSFALRIDKLLDLEMFSDGARLTDDKGKIRQVKFNVPENTDIVGAVLTQVINGEGK